MTSGASPVSQPSSGTPVTLDDLAAAVVVAVHRLTKQATLYTTENQAQLRQIEETRRAVAEYGRRTGRNPRLFFTERAVFVGGRLLYGGRQTYESAIELGRTLAEFGVDEMAIGFDVPAEDLRDYQLAVAEARRTKGRSPASVPYKRIRLRRGSPPGRRLGMQDEELRPEQRLVRLYATAIVVMRRFLESVQRGSLRTPVRVRRIAQLLAELGAVQSPAFLGATALYNSRHEHAGRAVNSALLALGMARQITDDVRLLARIAMAALLYDVGLPRAAGTDPTGEDRVGLALPTLGEDQLERLPAATAAAITALTGMGEAGMTYAVLVYEAHYLNLREHLPPLYGGERPASLEARIVATARRFTQLLASTEEELSADDAIRRIETSSDELADQTTVRLLMAAIGLVPSGTLVELSTGAIAQVVKASTDPTTFHLPVVRPVVDASGGRISRSGLLDLSKQRGRKGAVEIRRVVALSGARQADAVKAFEMPDSDGFSARPGDESATRSEPPMNEPGRFEPASFGNQSADRNDDLASDLDPHAELNWRRPDRHHTGTDGSRDEHDYNARAGYTDPPDSAASFPPSDLDDDQSDIYPEALAAAMVDGTGSSYDEETGSELDLPEESVRGLDVAHGTPPPSVPLARRPTLDPATSSTIPPHSARPGLRRQSESDDEVPSLVMQALVDASISAPTSAPTPSSPGAYALNGSTLSERSNVSTNPPARRTLFGSDIPSGPRSRDVPIHTPSTRDAAHDERLAERRVRNRAQVPTPTPPPTSPPGGPPRRRHSTGRQAAVSADLQWARRRLAGRKPTAQGRLDKTPLVHLLVYALDRRLSGTTMLVAPNGEAHFYYCDDGLPAKARTSVGVHALDRVIRNLRLVSQVDLEQSLRAISQSGELHGRYLVDAGLLTTADLHLALAHQVMRKLEFMLGLPGATRYAYFQDVNLLHDYGGPESCHADPMALIMAGVRALGSSTIVDKTLSKLENVPLRLQRTANVRLLRLSDEEQALVDILRARPLTLRALLRRQLAPERTVLLLVYALVVTRALNVGTDRPPLGFGRDLPVLAPLVEDSAPPSPQRPEVPAPISVQPTRRSPRPHPAERAMPAHDAVAMPPPSPRELNGAPRSSRPTAPIGSPLPHVGGAPGMPRVTSRPTPRVSRKSVPHQRQSGPISRRTPGEIRRPLASSKPPARSSMPKLSAEQITSWHGSIDQQSFYEILGVERDATIATVQSRYFALARLWHPDRLPAELAPQRAEAARVFARINESFQTISVAGKRQDYDRILDAGGGTAREREIVERAVDSAMLFQKAEVMFRRGEYDRAEQMLDKAISNDPDEPAYRALRAWVQAHQLGAPTDEQSRPHFYGIQLAELDEVIELDPKYERALYYRAELFKRSGKLQDAIRDFKAVVKLNPHNIDAAREVRLFEKREERRRNTGGILGRWFRKTDS